MRRALALLAAVALLGLPLPAQAATVEDLEKKIDRMQKTYESQINELQAEIRQLKANQARAGVAPADAESVPFPAKLAGKRAESAPQFGGIYDKPHLRRFGRNTYLGGYVDSEFVDKEDENRKFDQHRLIPFIYSDISDKIKFATEIEFEHGGTDNNQSNGEVKVEFATLDYLIKEWLNLRTGIVLSPLGKVNLVHDSPLQDLTDRPLVDKNIIPTTLSEAGAGLYGSFYPTELSKVDYEAYLVNGFDGGGSLGSDISAKINVNSGVRSARGSQKSDNNNNLAVVGRVAVSPFIGAEIGGSVHHGAYSDDGKLDLSIYALDWLFQKGPFEFLGEFAHAEIERSQEIISFNRDSAASATSTSRIPGSLSGYYLQGNYHFMPPVLKKWFPNHFTDESTFTFVTRWEQVDLNGDEASDVGERDRLTLGLNFRPIEDTVLKLDYQINNGDQAKDDRDAFIASVASYF